MHHAGPGVIGLFLCATSAFAADTPTPAKYDAKPEPSVEPARPVDAPAPHKGTFEFGSYGRVIAASDLQGGTGRQANIVSHGTRIDEDSYVELELRREDEWKPGMHTRIVTTMALFPPFFHFSGKVDQRIGVRNLYAQANVGSEWTLWAGSRMYRGDDIYLLNWWPLDNQNTIGGGASFRFPPETGDTTVAIHAGMQRLDDAFQSQLIQSPLPFGVTSTSVPYLDRPRTVQTLKVTHLLRSNEHKKVLGTEKGGFKFIGYAEAHELAAGVYRDTTINQDKPLPSDFGWLIGSQLTFYTGERDTHLSLVARHARGLAAYDPLAVPITFSLDYSTANASETQLALSGNYEHGPVTIPFGAYLRWFRDASPTKTSLYKYDEGAVVVRPHVFFGEHFGVAVEGSYQLRRHAFLEPGGSGPLTASLLRGGIIPFFSPAGRGTFKRPVFRVIYAVTSRNSGARSLYATDDTFSQRSVEHFLGVGTEWWFNFSSYP